MLLRQQRILSVSFSGSKTDAALASQSRGAFSTTTQLYGSSFVPEPVRTCLSERTGDSMYMNLFQERKKDFLKRNQRLRSHEYWSSSSIARLNCQTISNQPSP